MYNTVTSLVLETINGKILSTVWKEKTISKAVSHHNNATTVAILDFILMH